MNSLDLLRENRLLSGCPDDVLERFAPLVEERCVPAGNVLYRQGEPADAMYLVLIGAVHLTRQDPENGREELLARVEAGDFFGDMALLDAKPHAVQAAAAEESTLARVDRQDVEEILRLAPHVVPLNFVRAVHRRVKDAHPHFTEEILRGDRLSHVGKMAGTIIHDFKTPLTTILCACDLLERPGQDETHRRLSEIIKRSVERMMAMTQELLDYTLGGSARLHFEPLTIERLLAGLDEQCLGELERQGYTVERCIQYHGAIEVDAPRFERMLLNIIKNAKEAMGKTGRLCFGVSADETWATFEIADSGHGMTPEVAAKIFEPFFTDGKPLGTGLGMSMVLSVVDAHRGTIEMESKVGRGTKFKIKVPLRQG